MNSIDSPTVAAAINALICAQINGELNQIGRTYGNLEIALKGIDAPIADTTGECTSTSIRLTVSINWQTKDMALVQIDKIYALWYCDSITGEVLRINGRVTREGKLAEIGGMDAASINVDGLYLWRVNCLKDQLAAESTSTVVEVDYETEAELS